MAARADEQKSGLALILLTVAVYFSRPWSCWYALSQFTPEDPVPYSHFDYHGWIAMFGWLAALAFFIPTIWLASRAFPTREIAIRLFGRAPDTKTTMLSVLIALALGAPTYSQIAYILALPAQLSLPVLASSLAWFLIVEIGRTAAVQHQVLDRGVVRVAGALALIITLPKFALIVFAEIDL